MNVFLGWSGTYAQQIAEALKQALDQLVGPGPDSPAALRTWLSTTDIDSGSRWWEALHQALGEADHGIVVITQDAVFSSWLPHEMGALSRQGVTLHLVLADTPPALVPEPLKGIQYVTTSREHISRLISAIARQAKATNALTGILNQLYGELARARENFRYTFVTSENHRWEGNFERPVAIARQEQSPYDLEQLFLITRNRLVLVAQNHGYMTNPGRAGRDDDRFWKLAENLLARGADIDIIAMHEDAKPTAFPGQADSSQVAFPDALELWAYYMQAGESLKHAKHAWEMLEEWATRHKKMASREGCGQLRLWASYFTPVTMSFVDPESADGLLILSPRMGHEANNSRPQFVLKKKTCPVTFAYYWGSVDNSFDNAGWTRVYPADNAPKAPSKRKKR